MEITPYIGITGFRNDAEVSTILTEMERISPTSQRKLMVGVLISTKTLNGNQNARPNRYPPKDEVVSVFVKHKRALGLVHLHCSSNRNLLNEMWQIGELCAPSYPGMTGFQINSAWPSPTLLRVWHCTLTGFGQRMNNIVLRIGTKALDKVDHDPDKLALRVVAEYGSVITHVLIDPSGGCGKALDPDVTLKYLRALRETGTNLGLGVAGGLCAETMHLLKPIMAEFPGISIDAEGKLRTTEDKLDVEAAIRYVRAFYEMFP